MTLDLQRHTSEIEKILNEFLTDMKSIPIYGK